MSKLAPRSNGPIPLERLLVFGGIALDDYETVMADEEADQAQQTDAFQGSKTTMQSFMPCTVLHFTNSSQTPLAHLDPEESKARPRKKRK